MPDIDFGQLSEALNDKMDRDAHNVQSPSAVVIAKQDPTSDNNYTWYRLYSDGWVEQGGVILSNSIDGAVAVTFLIIMADIYYGRNASLAWTTSGSTATNAGAARAAGAWQNPTTTGIQFQKQGTQSDFYWEVKGIAA